MALDGFKDPRTEIGCARVALGHGFGLLNPSRLNRANFLRRPTNHGDRRLLRACRNRPPGRARLALALEARGRVPHR